MRVEEENVPSLGTLTPSSISRSKSLSSLASSAARHSVTPDLRLAVREVTDQVLGVTNHLADQTGPGHKDPSPGHLSEESTNTDGADSLAEELVAGIGSSDLQPGSPPTPDFKAAIKQTAQTLVHFTQSLYGLNELNEPCQKSVETSLRSAYSRSVDSLNGTGDGKNSQARKLSDQSASLAAPPSPSHSSKQLNKTASLYSAGKESGESNISKASSRSIPVAVVEEVISQTPDAKMAIKDTSEQIISFTENLSNQQGTERNARVNTPNISSTTVTIQPNLTKSRHKSGSLSSQSQGTKKLADKSVVERCSSRESDYEVQSIPLDPEEGEQERTLSSAGRGREDQGEPTSEGTNQSERTKYIKQMLPIPKDSHDSAENARMEKSLRFADKDDVISATDGEQEEVTTTPDLKESLQELTNKYLDVTAFLLDQPGSPETLPPPNPTEVIEEPCVQETASILGKHEEVLRLLTSRNLKHYF